MHGHTPGRNLSPVLFLDVENCLLGQKILKFTNEPTQVRSRSSASSPAAIVASPTRATVKSIRMSILQTNRTYVKLRGATKATRTQVRSENT